MSARPHLPISALVLAGLCAALGGNLYVALTRSTGEETVAVTPASVPSLAAAQPDFDLPPRESFTEMLARPLFNETRRPREPDRTEMAPGQPMEAVLVGVIASPEGRVALVRARRGDKVQRVSEGDRIGHLKVGRILDDRLIFETEAREEIHLFPEKTKAISPGPAAKARTRTVRR